MFSTLQYDSTSNGPFVVQSTLPPFDLKRPSKLTRFACINCRTSKLKCSGEREGCQRCGVKEIECCYPKPSSGRRNVKPSKRHTLTGKAASQGDHSTSSRGKPQSPPKTPTNNAQFDFTRETSPQDMLESNAGHWLSQKDFEEQYDGDLSADVSDCLQDKVPPSLEAWQPILPADTAPKSPTMGADIGTDSPTVSRSLGSGLPSLNLTGISFVPELLCFCSSDAIGLYDYIQTTLVWPDDKTITSGALLQCQKKALSECENLLTCKSCTSQSKYITLIIAMCENLLSSMEGGCQIQSSSLQWNKERGTEPWDEIEENEDRPQEERQDKVPGEMREESSDRPTEETNMVVVGRWQLDSDDQLSVIQGLFSTRVARLLNLVAKLERIANEHQWSNQSRRIRDIQERCHMLSQRLKEHVCLLSRVEM
ncbi:hypothetical protein F5Y12DRAFT_554613 [Xylaria sp. FL1777]|nr:hypothetical protein F5Y12DRAFT_554613 [Xylaria sp. FL1777]